MPCRFNFRNSAEGPEGLVKGKKVYLAIAIGGIYTAEEAKPFDFTESYLRTVLGCIGHTDIMVFRVEGIALTELKDATLGKAVKIVGETALYANCHFRMRYKKKPPSKVKLQLKEVSTFNLQFYSTGWYFERDLENPYYLFVISNSNS